MLQKNTTTTKKRKVRKIKGPLAQEQGATSQEQRFVAARFAAADAVLCEDVAARYDAADASCV